ncbi:MAG: cytochrome P450 [Polyangiaceae bacterium]
MALPPSPKLSRAETTLRWFREPYAFLDECRARHGEVFSFRLLGAPPFVVFSHPDHVRQIFSDDGSTMAAGAFNRTLAPLLGDRSVLMADGREHVRKRKLLLPPFHGERMHSYGSAMLEIADRAIERLPRERPFAIHPVMQDVTLEVIVRTVFGIQAGPRADEMMRRTKRILELGAWAPLLLPFLQFELFGLAPYGRFKAAVAAGDAVLYEEIRRRRETGERGEDILSLLLDARDDAGAMLEPPELRDELVTLLVAGHETTATALTWALRWLLDQPGTYADVRNAVDALGADPSPEDIAKCELLDAAAREALRLVPVIPLVGRVLLAPASVGGYDLEAGTVVVCSIYLAHRRPEAFPNPTLFDPSRFVGRKFSAYEFFPFGGGMRRCIGMAFALYEMKLVLAKLLARTELRLAGPKREIRMVRRSITITPEDGLLVTMRERALRSAVRGAGETGTSREARA